MVRKYQNVLAKTGTVSTGGLRLAPRNQNMAKSFMLYKPPSMPSRYQKQLGSYKSGTELKAIDINDGTYGFTRPAGGGSIALLNGIQTGASFYNRIGSRVEMINLHIRGFIYYALTSVQDQVRMIVFYDRQPNGATPTASDVLQSRNQSGATINAGSSEINLDQRDRFVIIRDILRYIPSVTVTVGVLTNGPQIGGQDFQVNEFVKLKGLSTHYKSSSAPTTVGDIATGALFVMFISDTQDSTTGFNGNFRLRYADK